MNRATAQRLYLALVGGLLTVVAVFGSLFWLGTAPLLRTPPAGMIAIALAAVAGCITLFGWLWARPMVPLRTGQTEVEAFWQTGESGSRALLLWVLWEGSAMICAVGTLLTGSLITAGVALAALASLVTHGPGYLENRGVH